ncbi:MAG: periplasmic heavy metal sensor [Bryobacteraceae bacterium]
MRFKGVLLLLSVSVMFAQGPMPPPDEPMDPVGDMIGGPMGAPEHKGAPAAGEIKAYLNLDQAQIDKLNQIQKEAREGRQGALRKMQDMQRALRDALEAANPDPAAVGKLVIDLRASHKQMREGREQLHKQAIAVLREDQRAKLAELETAVEKLQPAIGQARMLNLLEPPAMGPMMGRQVRPGPGRMGMRPGRMGMMPDGPSPY